MKLHAHGARGVLRAQILRSMLVKKGGVEFGISAKPRCPGEAKPRCQGGATALACSSQCSLGQSHSRATCQPSTPVLAARAARREKLSEACHENRAFYCDLPSESAVFAMHAAVQTPKVVRQPAHHCELGLRPRGAQQRRLRGQNVPTPVRSAVFRSRSSGGRCEGFEPVGPPW